MTTNQTEQDSGTAEDNQQSDSRQQALELGIGAVGGGVAGAMIGNAVGGKKGRMVGAIAGAITGGLMGEVAGDDWLEDLIAKEQQAAEVLGEAPGENELPAHYSREQLQALSRSQPGAPSSR